MANVLIVGASHGIGLETVRGALRAGHNVRAFARSAAGIPIRDANLTKVSCNALDPDTIRNVLRDIGVVIQTLDFLA
jgi:NAD(P)-dependent dehydrogenase (short-subunit alcohol dehydrogenase family)